MPKPRRAAAQAAQPSAERIEALAARERAALESAHPASRSATGHGLVNRGCLIAPFHNRMLVCPATTIAQVERLVAAFDDVTGQLHA